MKFRELGIKMEKRKQAWGTNKFKHGEGFKHLLAHAHPYWSYGDYLAIPLRSLFLGWNLLLHLLSIAAAVVVHYFGFQVKPFRRCYRSGLRGHCSPTAAINVHRDGSNFGWMGNKSGHYFILFISISPAHTQNRVNRPQSWKCLHSLLISLTSHRQCCLSCRCVHLLSRYSRVYCFPRSWSKYGDAYDWPSSSSRPDSLWWSSRQALASNVDYSPPSGLFA